MRPQPRSGPARGTGLARAYGLGLAALTVLLCLSVTIGSRPIPLPDVWRAFVAFDAGNDLHLIVRALRLPRAALAVTAGAGLGLAGALMQAVTRNPLAEPGLLGVNAGAALAIVLGSVLLGTGAPLRDLGLGFLGAGLAGVAVFVLGRARSGGTDPLRLVLAGAGLSVLLGALSGLLILNAGAEVLDVFRNWGTGMLEGRGWSAPATMAVALGLGGGLAIAIAPALNALALGEDLARGLGLAPGAIWALACLGVMLLAGAATATAGPIAFVGLVAPHLARRCAGPDSRAVLMLSALIAAGMLLLADVLGRIVATPEEVAAGLLAALMGGPFFVAAVRRHGMVQL